MEQLMEQELQRFLELLHLHHKGQVRVIYPFKCDRENYVFDLENDYRNKYNQNLQSKNIRYTDFFIYKRREEEIKDDCTLIVDPRCYLQEIQVKDNILKEIVDKCKTTLKL